MVKIAKQPDLIYNPFNIDMDYFKLIPLGKRLLFIALLVVFACEDEEINVSRK